MIRVPADWMVGADDRILEYLDYEGVAAPSVISKDERIDLSRTHISNRLRKLRDANLVENVGNGVYRITDRGSGYLRGEIQKPSSEA